MDANRLRFWMLATKDAWSFAPADAVSFDASKSVLRLASRRDPPARAGVDAPGARAALDRAPGSIDAFGTYAFVDSGGRVAAAGALPDPTVIITPPRPVSDVAIGFDGLLYVAIADAVILHDLRGDFDDVTIPLPGAWRLAPLPGGGALVLGKQAGGASALSRLEGKPLNRIQQHMAAPHDQADAARARPVEPNTHPVRVIALPAIAIAGEEPVAIRANAEGRVAVLFWHGTSPARVRLLDSAYRPGDSFDLAGALRPVSLTWLAFDRVALLFDGLDEAPSYVLDIPGPISVAGELYPLRAHDGGPFLHTTSTPPYYARTAGPPAPLLPVSLPSYARSGKASGGRPSVTSATPIAAPFDAGEVRAVWHRLYLEASIPALDGIRVLLAATDDPVAPTAAEAWHEHRFGAVPDRTDRAPVAGVVRGAWVPFDSEVPFQKGLLRCPKQRDRSGLFTALVQRPGLRVRALSGRYLHVRVELFGDGRTTPEIAALRAYASRFSYVDHYLPELYRETVFAPDTEAVSESTSADFLERFLDNCEGVLTPIEDRIAASYLLTDARITPEPSLEWLASWIGFTLDPIIPIERRRALLARAAEIQHFRGTLRGLSLALDLATGGAVTGGRVVILEGYRLRRTFATILGADLDLVDDPLLVARGISGNSYLGDTFFLGDDHERELLALFEDDLQTKRGDAEAVARFLDALADRVIVLLHEEIEKVDRGIVARVIDLETPAHVDVSVADASYPFLVGIASLIGVDTYLARPPGVEVVRVNESRLGVRDVLLRPPTLDPRTEGGGG